MRLLCLALLLFTLPAWSTPSHFQSGYGFSITPPEAATVNEGVVAHFYLPANKGFAANVNVMIQAFEGGLTAYDEITQQEFQQYGLTLIERQQTPTYLQYEYRGSMSGMAMHWYARAYVRGDRIYLVTATALASDWPQQKATLMAAVNSFSF